MLSMGVDVGGTFTDFVVLDPSDNTIRTAKVPSTPANPAEAILAGLASLIQEGVEPGELGSFLHGTTVTTNALIQLRGARCGLLVTRDLKGIAQIQAHQKLGPRHSMRPRRPPVLVDELNVFEIGGRLDHDGNELVELSEEDVHRGAPHP